MTGADDVSDVHVDCDRDIAEHYHYLDGHHNKVPTTTNSAHLDL